MPDKEFDNLFRDKFKGAEIEPSANFWANIEEQIAPKRKRAFPLYWVAAASVAVVLTSILVFQKDEKLQLRGQDAIAQVDVPKVQPQVSTAVENIHVVSATADKDQELKRFVASLSQKAGIKAPINADNSGNERNISSSVQPIIADIHLPIKKQNPISIDVLPANNDVVKEPVYSATADVKTQSVDTENSEVVSEDKKGIRNVGDIVNFVVDKIDRRDKKLIRFNTDDDDNSSIVGINIGFLKLNKKHK